MKLPRAVKSVLHLADDSRCITVIILENQASGIYIKLKSKALKEIHGIYGVCNFLIKGLSSGTVSFLYHKYKLGIIHIVCSGAAIHHVDEFERELTLDCSAEIGTIQYIELIYMAYLHLNYGYRPVFHDVAVDIIYKL